MPKKADELSALQVKRLTKPGHYCVGGVAGLALQVGPSGARTWVLRVMMAGRRRDMGLGGYPDVELGQAREKAREARAAVERGEDPILLRRQARSALAASRASHKTFDQCAREYIDTQCVKWRNPKHAAQWTNTIETYANPVIGKFMVSDIELSHVLSILRPIWDKKTETAKRLRGRLEAILDWATIQGFRTGSNPAQWKGRLDKILPAPSKVARVVHHPALPIDELPGFMSLLRAQSGLASRALEFAILTAARSGEARGAVWSEIDLERRVWTIPPERMKAGRDHRVPLSAAAVDVLRNLPRVEDTQLVFASRKKTPLSDMALTEVLRRMKLEVVPHGFRSTFRDWCSERTEYPREIAEMALAHQIESKVEKAYRRGDLFDKRAKLMNEWAEFCLNSDRAVANSKNRAKVGA